MSTDNDIERRWISAETVILVFGFFVACVFALGFSMFLGELAGRNGGLIP